MVWCTLVNREIFPTVDLRGMKKRETLTKATAGVMRVPPEPPITSLDCLLLEMRMAGDMEEGGISPVKGSGDGITYLPDYRGILASSFFK